VLVEPMQRRCAWLEEVTDHVGLRNVEVRRARAEELVGIVEAEALRRGAARIVFWSDTRFTNAHRLYERMGYVRHPGERDLGDISNSREYFFEKALDQSGTAGGRNASAR